MKQIIAQSIALIVFMTCWFSAQAEIIVIVNPNSGIDSIDSKDLEKLYMGKSSKLPGMGEVIPIDFAPGTPERDEFYYKYTRKNQGQLEAYWARKIFTGEGQPPKTVKDESAMLELVRKNPSVIGYIPSGSDTTGITVLEIK